MINQLVLSKPNNYQAIKAHPLWAMVAAFGCYFCVYGFRKPFTAGLYLDHTWGEIHWKSVLISAQIAGYMLSKWCGIFFVSSITRENRAKAILLSIAVAQLALFGFGLCPAPWNFVFLLLNGLPLGMIFGYIQGYLEGKRTAELLIASLASSFILADGVAKTVGKWLLEQGIIESWMPFMAGLVYGVPFLLFLWMLTQIPQPTAADIADRAVREPMTMQDRMSLLKKLGPGILGITLLYLFASLLRGIRSDFAPEIWKQLGYAGNAAIFSQSEAWVMAGILLINSSLVLIKKNKQAFFISLFCIQIGYVLLVLSSNLGVEYLKGFWLIVLTGFGIYMPYITITTAVFERMIAITREKANISFLMYIVDSIGYLGYNLLLLSYSFLFPNWNIPQLFFTWTYNLGWIGLLVSLGTWFYFSKKLATD